MTTAGNAEEIRLRQAQQQTFGVYVQLAYIHVLKRPGEFFSALSAYSAVNRPGGELC